MRKIPLVLVLLCALLMTCSAYAGCKEKYVEDEEYRIDADHMHYEQSPVNKLGRGLINAATFWTEIPAEVCKVSNEHNPVIGLTVGLAQGVGSAIMRGVTAAVEVVTFMVPPYNKPMMRPEYALEHADDEIQEYLW